MARVYKFMQVGFASLFDRLRKTHVMLEYENSRQKKVKCYGTGTIKFRNQ